MKTVFEIIGDGFNCWNKGGKAMDTCYDDIIKKIRSELIISMPKDDMTASELTIWLKGYNACREDVINNILDKYVLKEK